jgi:hypothetical protein
MTFFQEHWPQMTPIEREQHRALVALWRELRVEVLQRAAERDDISVVEPVLACPRSALNPQFVDADE